MVGSQEDQLGHQEARLILKEAGLVILPEEDSIILQERDLIIVLEVVIIREEDQTIRQWYNLPFIKEILHPDLIPIRTRDRIDFGERMVIFDIIIMN